jgi:hypothetical protein
MAPTPPHDLLTPASPLASATTIGAKTRTMLHQAGMKVVREQPGHGLVALHHPAVILRDDVIFADLHFRNGSLLAGHVPATREA